MKSAKEVLAKAKEMQSGNFAMSSLKEEVNKMAYENLQKGMSCHVCYRKNVLISSLRSEEGGSGQMSAGVQGKPKTGLTGRAGGAEHLTLVHG